MSEEIVKTGEQGIAKSKWDEQLAKYAQEASDSEYGGGSFIQLQAGQITISGEPVKDNKLDVIVVGSIYENVYYGEKYNAKNKKPPKCFAFSPDGKNMVPHPEAAEPQHTSCEGCPHNEFGSDPEGDGKACKNIRRLGLVAADIKPEAMMGTEVLYLKTPVTSTKAWGTYVKALNAMYSRPPFGVVTRISTKPHAQHQFHLTFEPVAILTDDYLTPIMQKREAVMDSIDFPYAKPSEAEAAEAAKSGKF